MSAKTYTDCAEWMAEVAAILTSPGFGFTEEEANGLLETAGMTVLQPAWVRRDSPEQAARLVIA